MLAAASVQRNTEREGLRLCLPLSSGKGIFLVGIGCSLIPCLSGGAVTHVFVPGASASQLLQGSRDGESQTPVSWVR